MFNFIEDYSGCVGMDPSALLCPGASDAVKTALSSSMNLEIVSDNVAKNENNKTSSGNNFVNLLSSTETKLSK